MLDIDCLSVYNTVYNHRRGTRFALALLTRPEAAPCDSMPKSRPPKSRKSKANLSAKVFAELKERIIRWKYAPGQRFTEEQLCDEFGVSRSPIREALRMLVENGLVEKMPLRGYTVRQPNLDEIFELYDLRLALETFAVERLAEAGLAADEIAPLRQTWEILLGRLPQVGPDVARADEEFHETLARAAGNQAITALVRNLNERLSFVRMADITTPERLELTCRQHLQVLESIAARDPGGAREAMRLNILQGRENVAAAFKDALAMAYQNQRTTVAAAARSTSAPTQRRKA